MKMTPDKRNEGMKVFNPNDGCEFNQHLAIDKNDNMSLNEIVERFQRKRNHVQHDDFSGLPTSSILANLRHMNEL